MTVLPQIAALLLIVWLPGAVLYRLPRLERPRRASLEPEERVFWAIILSLGWSLAATLALAAAGGFTLGRLLLVNGVATGGIIAIFRAQLILNPPRRTSATALIPLVLALSCAMRFTPAAEYVIGGKDPGAYLNQGIQMAERGSLDIVEPVVASLPASARDLFFPQHFDSRGDPLDYYAVRFMGFLLEDPDRGVTMGQFPHLFPASIAIAYGIGGVRGALYATPFWATAGLLAVYFFAVRLFGRPAAGAAAGLLALNVATVWFARYPNTEMVMQALLFAALLANARAHIDGDRFFAPVAGALLGLLLFLRFDVVLGVAGIALGLLFGVFGGRRPCRGLIVSFALVAAGATAYYLGPSHTYATGPRDFLITLSWLQTGALAAGLAGTIAALWVAVRRPALAATVAPYLPGTLAVTLCTLGVYALFFRHPGGRLAAHDAFALRTYADFYVATPVVLAALLGYAIYAYRAFWRDPSFFTTVAIFAAFLFYKIRIVPEHFWTARRFLPVVLPATLLFACAAALGTLRSREDLRRIGVIAGIGFVATTGVYYASASAPVAAHVEYAGMIPQLERLASQFTDTDLIVAEARDAQTDIHVIATALAYTYGRNVLVLNSARPDKAVFAEFLEWARTRYRRVCFVGGGGTDLLSAHYSVKPLWSSRFQVPEYDSPLNAYPVGPRRKEFEFTVYELGPPNARTAAGDAFDLDIGVNDDLHVLRFHAKEQSEGRTFRWTRATSYVSVRVPPHAREFVAVLGDGGRPAAAPAPVVRIFLHNQQLGSVTVSGPFKPYALPVPPALAARAVAQQDPVELRLSTATWTPSRLFKSDDHRALGVMVDRVTLR